MRHGDRSSDFASFLLNSKKTKFNRWYNWLCFWITFRFVQWISLTMFMLEITFSNGDWNGDTMFCSLHPHFSMLSATPGSHSIELCFWMQHTLQGRQMFPGHGSIRGAAPVHWLSWLNYVEITPRTIACRYLKLVNGFFTIIVTGWHHFVWLQEGELPSSKSSGIMAQSGSRLNIVLTYLK